MKSTALALSIVLAAALKSADAFTPQSVPSKGNKLSSEIGYKTGTDATELNTSEQKENKLQRIIENQKNLYANKTPWRVDRPITHETKEKEEKSFHKDENDIDLGALSLLESKDVKAYINFLKEKRAKEEKGDTKGTISTANEKGKAPKDFEIKVNTFGANARISNGPPKAVIKSPAKSLEEQNTHRLISKPEKVSTGRTWLSAAEKIKMARETAEAKKKMQDGIQVGHEYPDSSVNENNTAKNLLIEEDRPLIEEKLANPIQESSVKADINEEDIKAALKEKMIQDYIAHLEEKRRRNGEKIEEKSVVVKQGARRDFTDDPPKELKQEEAGLALDVIKEEIKMNTANAKKSKSSREIDDLKNLLNSLVERTDKFLDEPEDITARAVASKQQEQMNKPFPVIVETSRIDPNGFPIEKQPAEKHWTELVSQPILFRSMDMIGKPLTHEELARVKAQKQRRIQKSQDGMPTPLQLSPKYSSSSPLKSTSVTSHDYSTSFDQRMGLNPNQDTHQQATHRRASQSRNPGHDYSTSFDQRIGLKPNEDVNQTTPRRFSQSRNPGHDYTTSFDQRMGLNPNQDVNPKTSQKLTSHNPAYDYSTSFDQRMSLNPDGNKARVQQQKVQFKTVNQLDMNGNPIMNGPSKGNPSQDYNTSFDKRVGGFSGRPTESYGLQELTEDAVDYASQSYNYQGLPEQVIDVEEEAIFPNIEEEKAQVDAEALLKEKLIQEYIALMKERKRKEEEEAEKKKMPPPPKEVKRKGSIFHFKTLDEENTKGSW